METTEKFRYRTGVRVLIVNCESEPEPGTVVGRGFVENSDDLVLVRLDDPARCNGGSLSSIVAVHPDNLEARYPCANCQAPVSRPGVFRLCQECRA